jgi:hypothetical protein
MFSAGSTSTELDAGRRRSASSTTAWLMSASVASGRCGPCCSIAATGSSAMVRAGSTCAKSRVVRSCQWPLRSVGRLGRLGSAEGAAAAAGVFIAIKV